LALNVNQFGVYSTTQSYYREYHRSFNNKNLGDFMRFSYHACMCPPDQYLALAQAAESFGFDGFTLPDSICYPKVADTKYPYNNDGSRNFLEGTPFIDPFIAVASMAAVTEKLHFTTSVLKVPVRNPVLLAKQITSLNALTNNRFSLGAGISPWIEDFEICDQPWEKRGKRLDEMVEIIRGFHGDDYYSFSGEFYDIAAAKMCPVPSKPTPVLFGGHAELALKRAAKTGDGWIHAGGDIESLKPLIQRLNDLRDEYGTTDKPFEIHAMTADAYSLEGIERLKAIGVTECIIGGRDAYSGEQDNTSVEQKRAMMQWFNETIISQL
jgi:probable F420-dependent oxidoreductase